MIKGYGLNPDQNEELNRLLSEGRVVVIEYDSITITPKALHPFTDSSVAEHKYLQLGSAGFSRIYYPNPENVK